MLDKKQIFLEKTKLIHGDKYDYSLVNYKNNREKIIILCKTHGEFEQTPNHHINHKQGCPKCGKKQCLTNEEFIKKAKIIHGDKYDYSLVEYIDTKTKVKIICPIHGEFKQIPNSHLDKDGCVKCRAPLISDFISKAKKVHGDFYDYSLSKYKNAKIKIDIICPIHGVFKQKLNDHLYGNGCPICKESKGEKEIRVFLDKNKIKYIRQHKFNECKYKYKLPFDFYLPDYNICIEYNGPQHYSYLKFFHRNINYFFTQQLKDNIKVGYCKNNNITLLVIKHTENVEFELNKMLLMKK